MTQKQIEFLHIHFSVTVTVLELGKTIAEVSGGSIDERTSQMLALHKQALSELEKESPDIDVIGNLITQMEIIVSQKKPPKFPLGGIVSMPQIPALKNAVNSQDKIDKLVYLARKAGKSESEISECLDDTSTPHSVEQRLNKLIE